MQQLAGRGSYIPDGWEIPVFLGSLSVVIIMIVIGRWYGWGGKRK